MHFDITGKWKQMAVWKDDKTYGNIVMSLEEWPAAMEDIFVAKWTKHVKPLFRPVYF